MGNLVHNFYRTATVQLPLANARELSGGSYINTAGIGGVLTSDTTPALSFNSGGTRLTWAASNVDAIAWSVMAPSDFDTNFVVTVKIIASMGGSSDTPTVGISFVEGMSGSNVGGNTAALSTSAAVKSVTVSAANTAGGDQWTIILTPGTHGTDTLRIDAAWIEYTRR
jgi:hypothetical protein